MDPTGGAPTKPKGPHVTRESSNRRVLAQSRLNPDGGMRGTTPGLAEVPLQMLKGPTTGGTR